MDGIKPANIIVFCGWMGGILMLILMVSVKDFYVSLAVPVLVILFVVLSFRLDLGLYLLSIFTPIICFFIKYTKLHEYMSHWLATLNSVLIYIFFLIAMVIGWLMHKTFKPSSSPSNDAIIGYLLFLLFGWSLITLVWVPNIYHAILQTNILLFNILMFFIAVETLSDKTKLNRAISVWIFSAFLIALSAIGGLLYMKYHKFSTTQRYSFEFPIVQDLLFYIGIRLHPARATGLAWHNSTGMICNVGISLLFYRLKYVKTVAKKIFCSLLMVFLVMAVILTQSKAGIGTLILLGIVFISLNLNTRKWIIINSILWITLLVGSFILTQMLTNVNALDRVESSTVSTDSSNDSLGIRVEWWKKAAKKLYDKTYMMGLGPGGFKYYMEKDKVPYGHSIYFSVLFDMGVIGFLLLIAMIYYLLRYVYRAIMEKKGDEHYLIVVLTVVLFVIGLQGTVDMEYNTPYIWLLLGLIVAGLNIANSNG